MWAATSRRGSDRAQGGHSVDPRRVDESESEWTKEGRVSEERAVVGDGQARERGVGGR